MASTTISVWKAKALTLSSLIVAFILLKVRSGRCLVFSLIFFVIFMLSVDDRGGLPLVEKSPALKTSDFTP